MKIGACVGKGRVLKLQCTFACTIFYGNVSRWVKGFRSFTGKSGKQHQQVPSGNDSDLFCRDLNGEMIEL